MIDWNKFIQAGFEKATEVENARKYLFQNEANVTLLENDLHIRWRNLHGIKEFVVVCTCGNSRMIVHEKGIRCHTCGRFHSHDAFSKKRNECKKAARINDGKIEKLPQPLLNNKKNYGPHELGKITSRKRNEGTSGTSTTNSNKTHGIIRG